MRIKDLERPVLAVDVVIFSVSRGKLIVLTTRRKKEPFRDAPSLPGVAVRVDETLIDAARRAISEKSNITGITPDDIFIEQLAAFDGLYRDPRGRTISVAFLGITKKNEMIHEDVVWKKVEGNMLKANLPFDHGLIIDSALERLRGKLKYTNIAAAFLPNTFRIDELQEIYEAILELKLNTANFRNKLLKIGLIEKVRVLSGRVGARGGRPPHAYRFNNELLTVVDRDFL